MSMKYTLLQMTQRILESMDSDEVTTILETPESTVVAKTIEECFYELIGILDLPEHYQLFQLEESAAATPVMMTTPTHVRSIDWVKYDHAAYTADSVVSSNYTDVTFMPLEQFLLRVGGLNADDDTTVDQYSLTNDTGETFTLKYWNERMPQFWTSFDDSTILFDAIDMIEDTSLLVDEKTMCWGLVAPTFTQSDSFEAPLDHNQFALLLNEAKSQCFAELKQSVNPKAEQKSRRNLISTQKRKQNIGYPHNLRDFYELPNYGRK
jgi:hypothetical protein